MSKKVLNVDLVKGIGIILVMIGHSGMFLFIKDKALLNMIADKSISTSKNDMTKEELSVILEKIKRETNTIINEDTIARL